MFTNQVHKWINLADININHDQLSKTFEKIRLVWLTVNMISPRPYCSAHWESIPHDDDLVRVVVAFKYVLSLFRDTAY